MVFGAPVCQLASPSASDGESNGQPSAILRSDLCGQAGGASFARVSAPHISPPGPARVLVNGGVLASLLILSSANEMGLPNALRI